LIVLNAGIQVLPLHGEHESHRPAKDDKKHHYGKEDPPGVDLRGFTIGCGISGSNHRKNQQQNAYHHLSAIHPVLKHELFSSFLDDVVQILEYDIDFSLAEIPGKVNRRSGYLWALLLLSTKALRPVAY
jgi:hypothetical protein